MTTSIGTAPVLLDAAAVADLPTKPLGEIAGVSLRVLWSDAHVTAGVLTLEPGRRLGEHTHRHHHHHIWVLEGSARVMGRDLGAGSYAHIPVGVAHDVDATSTDGCSLFYLYVEDGPAQRSPS